MAMNNIIKSFKRTIGFYNHSEYRLIDLNSINFQETLCNMDKI